MKHGLKSLKAWWNRRQSTDKIVPPVLVAIILLTLTWAPVSGAITAAAKNVASTQVVAAER